MHFPNCLVNATNRSVVSSNFVENKIISKRLIISIANEKINTISTIATTHRSSSVVLLKRGGMIATESNNIFGPEVTIAFILANAELIITASNL